MTEQNSTPTVVIVNKQTSKVNVSSPGLAGPKGDPGTTDYTLLTNKPDLSQYATQTQLNLKAAIASPTFTGIPAAPTAVSGTSTTQLATTAFVQQEINVLTSGAPTALNTLDELAAALGDDANFAATLTTSLGNKQDKVSGVSDTEISYLDGVTSSIQTQINNKQDKVSGVSDTEIGYLDGVTSAIQTQINNKQDKVTNVSDTEISYLDGVTSGIQSQIDSKLSQSGGTMTGALTLSGAPTSNLHAVTKQYVDGIAAGINFHQPVVAATVGNLDGTYNNGTDGYLATLTKASNGSIGTIDNASVSVGNRILLRAQTDPKQNGIYTITAIGSSSAPWQITRASDADNNPNGELNAGDFCFVTSGATNGSKGFILNTSGTITIGTTDINYVQFNASDAVIAGDGITKNGATISISEGAITSSMILNGTIVDADISNSAAISTTKISGLDAALTAKAPIASPTFTGTVSGITKSMIGLENVDNTSDASKPISSAVQTALDAKLSSSTAATTYAPLASPTFTGTVNLSGATVTGIPTVLYTDNTRTASYTLTSTDIDAIVWMNASSANTVTLPPDSITIPNGASVTIWQNGTGQTTIIGGSGVTVYSTGSGTNGSTPKLRTQFSCATAVKKSSNTWYISGDII